MYLEYDVNQASEINLFIQYFISIKEVYFRFTILSFLGSPVQKYLGF